MLKERDLLVCDFAEFYHVLDIDALPLRLLATLAAGLPERARSKRKLAGCRAADETLLLAAIADSLRLLVWQNTADGSRGRNKPESILSLYVPTGENETQGFESAEAFEKERERILRNA